MTPKDTIGLIIVGSISLVLIIISIFLLRGKGSRLIAGYNTAKDKEKYDSEALCKFVGKILFPIALFLPSVAIAGIFKIKWISIAFLALVLGLVVFALIYANTNNRFKN